jgi:hypothetical protein
MDDEPTPDVPHRLAGRTSDRVREMSDEERRELARKIAGHPGYITPDPDSRDQRREKKRTEDPATLAEIARLTTELRRTERRLDRLDRMNTPSRYQVGTAGPPSGRYARLESRARRLERQLRALA